MTGPFGLPATCLACTGPLHILHARACPTGTETVAVLGCDTCGRQWAVAAQMRLHGQNDAGRQRRYRAGKAAA